MGSRQCEYCEAHLDPGEKCNCREIMPSQEKSPDTNQSNQDKEN